MCEGSWDWDSPHAFGAWVCQVAQGSAARAQRYAPVPTPNEAAFACPFPLLWSPFLRCLKDHVCGWTPRQHAWNGVTWGFPFHGPLLYCTVLYLIVLYCSSCLCGLLVVYMYDDGPCPWQASVKLSKFLLSQRKGCQSDVPILPNVTPFCVPNCLIYRFWTWPYMHPSHGLAFRLDQSEVLYICIDLFI